MEFETVARKWGNSLGLTLPKNVIEEVNIQEHEKIKLLVIKENKTLKNTFGMVKGKLKKNTQKIKSEIKSELHNA
tara:strand:+ start:186 stop:410 length:225 start_codon:yes stop_codon:yes gene_type:complete